MGKSKKKCIVIKIGSALLADQETGALKSQWLDSLVDDVAKRRTSDFDIIIVSSGSVALGKKNLKQTGEVLRLEEKQAAAACGQMSLINSYQDRLAKHDLKSAQILLTIEDFDDRRRYLNARSTIQILLEQGIIPIINENDTVATSEMRVGDNDRLAARVAEMIGADRLVLFSDVDGLYKSNPRTNPDAEHVAVVEEINDNIKKMADGAGSTVSSGGMITKIEAASIATAIGCETIIASGIKNHPLEALDSEDSVHTVFVSNENPRSARKHWIAHSLNIVGEAVIDDGAANALNDGNSLLPAGVVSVSGKFDRGDAIAVKDKSGKEVARGLVAYSYDDAKEILGLNSSEIEEKLGYSGRSELIHRDDLVLL